jgi:hypothetical protein
MQSNFAFSFAPDNSGWQAASQLAAYRLVSNAAIQTRVGMGYGLMAVPHAD